MNQKQDSNIRGNYLIGESIGEGAFGKVRVATHVVVREKVAIKILDKKKMHEVTKDINRIQREIHILKKLRHKNIVQLYEIIESNKSLFLVLEYCEKKELFDYIVYKKRLAEPEACKLFQDLINGVDYLHQNNIAHRDLKPENLLLDSSYTLKISDFGLSSLYRKNSKLATPCGTPSYAPPEMLRGVKYEGVKSDVWSCGIILFAMLAGYLPFNENKEEIVYKRIMASEYTIPKYISASARDLIQKMMAINPTERFDLEQIKGHSWFKEAYGKKQSLLRPGVFPAIHRIPVDEKILDICVELYKSKGKEISREELKERVLGNKYDSLSAVYYLCLRKFVKEGNASVSDLMSQAFLDYINDPGSLKEGVSPVESNKKEIKVMKESRSGKDIQDTKESKEGLGAKGRKVNLTNMREMAKKGGLARDGDSNKGKASSKGANKELDEAVSFGVEKMKNEGDKSADGLGEVRNPKESNLGKISKSQLEKEESKGVLTQKGPIGLENRISNNDELAEGMGNQSNSLVQEVKDVILPKGLETQSRLSDSNSNNLSKQEPKQPRTKQDINTTAHKKTFQEDQEQNNKGESSKLNTITKDLKPTKEETEEIPYCKEAISSYRDTKPQEDRINQENQNAQTQNQPDQGKNAIQNKTNQPVDTSTKANKANKANMKLNLRSNLYEISSSPPPEENSPTTENKYNVMKILNKVKERLTRPTNTKSNTKPKKAPIVQKAFRSSSRKDYRKDPIDRSNIKVVSSIVCKSTIPSISKKVGKTNLQKRDLSKSVSARLTQRPKVLQNINPLKKNTYKSIYHGKRYPLIDLRLNKENPKTIRNKHNTKVFYTKPSKAKKANERIISDLNNIKSVNIASLIESPPRTKQRKLKESLCDIKRSNTTRDKIIDMLSQRLMKRKVRRKESQSDKIWNKRLISPSAYRPISEVRYARANLNKTAPMKMSISQAKAKPAITKESQRSKAASSEANRAKPIKEGRLQFRTANKPLREYSAVSARYDSSFNRSIESKRVDVANRRLYSRSPGNANSIGNKSSLLERHLGVYGNSNFRNFVFCGFGPGSDPIKNFENSLRSYSSGRGNRRNFNGTVPGDVCRKVNRKNKERLCETSNVLSANIDYSELFSERKCSEN